MSGDSKLVNMLQKLSHIEQNLSEMGSQYNKIKKTYEESKGDESLPESFPATARDQGNETGRSLETIIVMEDGTQPSPLEKKKQEQSEVKGLSSFKRFLSQGEDDGTAESDVILSNTYKEEDSSVDQIQELL